MSLQPGRVLKRMRGFYYVDIGESELRLCRVKGSLFQGHAYKKKIAVGDWVEVDISAAEDSGLIHQVQTRTSQLTRSIRDNRFEQVLVSNVDFLLIVAAIRNPTFSFGLVDRLIVAGIRGNLTPILIVNKADLSSESEIAPIQELYESLGYQVLCTSVPEGSPEHPGCEVLRNLIKGQTSVFFGHSGVGKTSLLKALFPNQKLRIGQIDKKRNKGKHTTSIAEMFPLPEGGYLVDTPGVRELALPFSREELDQYFVEFAPFLGRCHFKSCLHLNEPRCLIKEAVDSKTISPQRYHSYCSILQSLDS